MKTALVYAVTLLAFFLMAVDPYLMTWVLIIFAAGASVTEWSKRFR